MDVAYVLSQMALFTRVIGETTVPTAKVTKFSPTNPPTMASISMVKSTAMDNFPAQMEVSTGATSIKMRSVAMVFMCGQMGSSMRATG